MRLLRIASQFQSYNFLRLHNKPLTLKDQLELKLFRHSQFALNPTRMTTYLKELRNVLQNQAKDADADLHYGNDHQQSHQIR